MNANALKGTWEQIKGTLKEKYAKLTDDDLKLAEGKEEEMYGKLQKNNEKGCLTLLLRHPLF